MHTQRRFNSDWQVHLVLNRLSAIHNRMLSFASYPPVRPSIDDYYFLLLCVPVAATPRWEYTCLGQATEALLLAMTHRRLELKMRAKYIAGQKRPSTRLKGRAAARRRAAFKNQATLAEGALAAFAHLYECAQSAILSRKAALERLTEEWWDSVPQQPAESVEPASPLPHTHLL